MNFCRFSIIPTTRLDQILRLLEQLDRDVKKLGDFTMEDRQVRTMTRLVQQAKERLPRRT